MFGFDVKDPGDPKKIDKAKVMKLLEKLGVASKPIEAEHVEIKTPEKIIRIKNPDIILTLLFGRDVYQITGEIEEIPLKFSEKELKKLATEAGKEKEEVASRLAELNYGVAKSVSELRKMKEAKKAPKKRAKK
jgi:NACalpha-BTF3-like transcription factor